MARNSKNDSTTDDKNTQEKTGFGSGLSRGLLDGRRVKNVIKQIDNLVGQSNLTLYGSDRTSDIDQSKSPMNTLLNTCKIIVLNFKEILKVN